MHNEKIGTKSTFTNHFIREVNVCYRKTKKQSDVIRRPEEIAKLFRSITVDNSREHFVAFYLDGASHVASYSIISIGTANSTVVSPREVFQRAVLIGAVSFIVAHNHPSGNLDPSREDLSLTQKLQEGGELLGIRLLDHIIVSNSAFLSMSETQPNWRR